MFANIENIKIESIYAGSTKKALSHSYRKSNTLFLRTSGYVRYVFPEFTFEAFPGDIVFLPRGSCYELMKQTDAPCGYVAIRLEDELYTETPFIYSIEGFPEALELENNLPDMWKFGGMAEHYRCYAVVYSLLAYLKNLEKLTYADKKKSNVIAPAISYLKEHIYDCNLKIDTLIQLCGVSGTYFHKIFKTNYSVSPQKYILSKRLSHARSVIDTGDFNSISEIAALVGYNDPLYFSRAFKKKYGVSPHHYAKQIFMDGV
mgnify:CR=1 FL=1